MENRMSVVEIERFVTDLFDGVVDKGGTPYIEHCLYVARVAGVVSDRAYVIGLLHDVIEDTDVTELDLLEMGIDSSIVRGVSILTRLSTETYSEYVDRVISSDDVDVWAVKYADSSHNLDDRRLGDGVVRSKSSRKRYEDNVLVFGVLLGDLYLGSLEEALAKESGK